MQSIDKTTIAQLNAIVKKYQKPDSRKAFWQAITSFGPFIALWILMYLSMDYSLWITFGLAIINGFFLVRIFIIQHDCGHQSFTRHKQLNNIVGQACSMLSFIPYKYWLKSHNYHHGHNGLLHEHRDIGDIELVTVKEYAQMTKLQQFGYRVFRSSIVLFGIVPTYYMLIHNRLPLINMRGWEKARRSLMFNNLGLVAVCTLIGIFLGWKALVFVHLPILMVFGTVAIWFFYVQHQHEEAYKHWKDKWDYTMAAIQGSTYYKLPKIMHWLTGNIGYHHIHHLNSLVPSYQLAKCHHENPIFDQIAVKMTFKESLSCAFNKLWDEQQEKMISFREYYRQIGQQRPLI